MAWYDEEEETKTVFTVKLTFEEIQKIDREEMFEVVAENEEEAIDSAWEKLYASEQLSSDDVEELDAKVEGSVEVQGRPGCVDTQTLELFPKMKTG